MNIQDLKKKSSEQLIDEAEKLGIENASTLKRQEIYFAILKKTCGKRRRNNRWWSSSTLARWFWVFKSNGVKLFTWS